MRCAHTTAFLVFGLVVAAARADVVLTIDTSNLSVARVASTGAFSTVTTTIPGGALLLMGAVTTPVATGSSLLGDFRPTLTGVVYNSIGNTPAFPTALLLSQPQSDPHGFSSSVAAFSGESTSDLTFTTIAPKGTVGDIHLRTVDGVDTGLVIGQYRIIPAPGWAAVLGVAGLVSGRRRRS